MSTPSNCFNLGSCVKIHAIYEPNEKKMNPKLTHSTAEVRFVFRLSEAQPSHSVPACVTQAVITHFGLGLSTVTPGSKC